MEKRAISPRTRFYRHLQTCQIGGPMKEGGCGYFSPAWQADELCFIGHRLWLAWDKVLRAQGGAAPLGRIVN